MRRSVDDELGVIMQTISNVCVDNRIQVRADQHKETSTSLIFRAMAKDIDKYGSELNRAIIIKKVFDLVHEYKINSINN